MSMKHDWYENHRKKMFKLTDEQTFNMMMRMIDNGCI